MNPSPARNIIEKIWDAHVVANLGADQCLLQIDRILLHERTGPALLSGLAAAGRRPANPRLVFGLMDHIVETRPGRGDRTPLKGGEQFIAEFRKRCGAFGITLFDLGDPRQGIVHVVSPEQGLALPGMTLVCPDSHTGTVGGVGALAWGIGSTEGEHAVATQTLIRKRPRSMRVNFEGSLGLGVSAKDMILALIKNHGAAGGGNHAIEFTGAAVRTLPVEARLTLCNMAVEFGAWTGLIAPDDTTIEWIAGRPFAPAGSLFDRATAHWRSLASDANAVWDAELNVDCTNLVPQVTWGTSPAHAVDIGGVVPCPDSGLNAADRAACERALSYMELKPGDALVGLPIDAAFIGSCTNARLSDLRAAAAVIKGAKIAPGVRAIVVPGSSSVKAAAEAEGLDGVFREAGFEWRESGCGLCFYAGGEGLSGARRIISSTNRNFEGRQGPGVRTHLASPLTVAASAVAGHIADPRPHLRH
ncbi:3-isopropylmalate dehydratase large subunit [Xanthobacter sp. KR7-225]|uniref:3-isopropylmalate dehydratase large subunit n=1 Tax=Xanthobacter sp. KR7-225 TaxID=3156613 RepID=UPI0032B33426